MICPQCKAKVPDKFSFCPQCGAPIRSAAAAPASAPGGSRALNTVNIALIGLLTANVVGGAFIIGGIAKKNRSAPEQSIAEDLQEQQPAETATAAPKTEDTTAAPPETQKTTEKTTEKTTVKTTEKTTSKTTKTTAKTTQTTAKTTAATTKTTTKTQPQQQQQQQQVVVETPAAPSTDPADYYASLGGMPFEVGYLDDPFLLPGIYTRASNGNGSALSEADAKQAMLDLPVNWDGGTDIFCGTEDDDNGTSNSTYRYIANAFPVPGFSDLQLPAAVDLYIHNGSAAHGSHVRALDYRYGNHPDYEGQYIWPEEEIARIFNSLTDYADGLYGGHEDVNDSLIAHYRYLDGNLNIGYYRRGNGTVLWISRSND